MLLCRNRRLIAIFAVLFAFVSVAGDEPVLAAKSDKATITKSKKTKSKKAKAGKPEKKVIHNGPSIVFDPRTGQVLSQVDAGAPWYPASLTKLMTAYIAFQDIRAGRFPDNLDAFLAPEEGSE